MNNLLGNHYLLGNLYQSQRLSGGIFGHESQREYRVSLSLRYGCSSATCARLGASYINDPVPRTIISTTCIIIIRINSR